MWSGIILNFLQISLISSLMKDMWIIISASVLLQYVVEVYEETPASQSI